MSEEDIVARLERCEKTPLVIMTNTDSPSNSENFRRLFAAISDAKAEIRSLRHRLQESEIEGHVAGENLRDTFAAAAVTGLLVNANFDIDEDTLDTPSDLAYTAYEMADAMLRERLRNGAPGGCETVPDPDSRVWETPRTPQPHATPPQGSVQDEGTFRDSRNAKEPVAWAVYCDGIYDSSFCGSDAQNEAEEWRNELRFESEREWVAVPLYRSPTLTDAEREAVEFALDRLRGTLRGNRECDHADTLRGLLERSK